jgi:hypothetical protein
MLSVVCEQGSRYKVRESMIELNMEIEAILTAEGVISVMMLKGGLE